MSNLPILSVTIATYKRCDLLEKSLNALAVQSISSKLFEIIICDSLSDDGTEEMIRRFSEKFPDLIIKHLHTENILAAKRNLGIRESSGKIVVFFDDDCVADVDCLYKYQNLFSNNPSKNIIYCGEVRFPPDWVASSNYYKFRDSRHFGGGRRKDLKDLDFKTIVVMNMAFNREEFIEKIGAVDESFIGYGCEDQDLGWRLQNKGFIIKRSESLIYHYEPSGNIQGYSKKLFHTARDGMVTLLKRNPAAVSALGVKFRLLDPDSPGLTAIEKISYGIIRKGLFNSLFEYVFSTVLIKIDRNKLLYFPSLYKYVLACAYVRGTKARLNKRGLSNNWYE
jgi:glycosyltransferase involved in cell wall biosynthesis